MTYKTILVHLNDERRVGQIVDVAAHLADRHKSHLIGLHVVPSSIVGSVTGIGGELIEGGRRAFRDEGKRIGAIFEKATAGRAIVPEWRSVEPDRRHPGCAEAVMEHGRAADLIIAGQTDESWDYHSLLDFPDRLAIESGRPTLIVPYAGRFPKFGRRVMVAWNGTREAARAVFDALPLLKGADAVQVVWIDPDADHSGRGDFPAAEITAALARHNVTCEAARTSSGNLDVGNVLLSRLADFGADLLVMGCYGRSRFRELILGGASREILRQMTVPVLMSH